MLDERFAKRLGSLIKQRRTELNLSQQSVAAGCGVHQAAVSVWERGQAIPMGLPLINLARTLNLEIADLHALATKSDDEEAA